MLKTAFKKLSLSQVLMRNGEFSISCFLLFDFYSSVQLLSCIWLFSTPQTAAPQASLSINSRSLLKLLSTESVMSSNYLILCRPFLLPPFIFYKNLY